MFMLSRKLHIVELAQPRIKEAKRNVEMHNHKQPFFSVFQIHGPPVSWVVDFISTKTSLFGHDPPLYKPQQQIKFLSSGT